MRTSYYSRKRHSLSDMKTIIPIFFGCFICWAISYWYSIGYPVYGEVSATPLWNKICEILPNKTFTYLLGLLLMTGGAFLLNRMNFNLSLIGDNTKLPFLFYIIALSTNTDFFPLKSTSFGVFCLILSMYWLFTSYHNNGSVENAFLSALIIGIGSLFWSHLLWFLPLFWIGMHQFRSLSLRTFAASLFGLVTICWLVLGICILQDDYTLLTTPATSLFDFRVLNFDSIIKQDLISILTVGLLTIIASINILINENDNSLRSRQYLYFLMLMALWSISLHFFYGQSSEEFLITSCIPTSLLIAHFFTLVRRKLVYRSFFVVIAILFISFFIRIWNSL